MKYRCYPEYKDSGLEWLGEVPAHWETRRLKYIASCNDDVLNEDTGPDWWIRYVDIGNVSEGKIKDAEELPFGNVPSRARRLVKNGDIIVSTVRTYLRAMAEIENPPDDMVVSTGFAVIRPQAVDGKFLANALKSNSFVDWVVAESKGISYPAINASELMGLSIALPPTDEQATIAAFLDEKTTQIDQLIEKKIRFIELLKEKRAALITEAVTGKFDVRTGKPYSEYKDSGVEWLGEVPTGWRTVKLRWVSDIQTGLALNNTVDQADPVTLPYLRVANVQDGYIDLTEIKSVSIEKSKAQQHLLQCGDVLMNEGGDNDKLGRGAVWKGEIDPCIHQNHVFAVRSSQELKSDWLAFVTQSHIAKYHFFVHSKQSTNLASISSSNIKELPVPLPPAEDQEAICSLLTKRLENIEKLKARVQQSINLLKEKRAALITAAVTGKIDVRDWNKEAA
ncbi:restriction endonuclease subunit S [Thiolapillus sp.]